MSLLDIITTMKYDKVKKTICVNFIFVFFILSKPKIRNKTKMRINKLGKLLIGKPKKRIMQMKKIDLIEKVCID